MTSLNWKTLYNLTIGWRCNILNKFVNFWINFVWIFRQDFTHSEYDSCIDVSMNHDIIKILYFLSTPFLCPLSVFLKIIYWILSPEMTHFLNWVTHAVMWVIINLSRFEKGRIYTLDIKSRKTDNTTKLLVFRLLGGTKTWFISTLINYWARVPTIFLETDFCTIYKDDWWV